MPNAEVFFLDFFFGKKKIDKKFQKRQLHQKLAEIKQERGEHELVADSLRKAEPERKAWRLVGKLFF